MLILSQSQTMGTRLSTQSASSVKVIEALLYHGHHLPVEDKEGTTFKLLILKIQKTKSNISTDAAISKAIFMWEWTIQNNTIMS